MEYLNHLPPLVQVFIGVVLLGVGIGAGATGKAKGLGKLLSRGAASQGNTSQDQKQEVKVEIGTGPGKREGLCDKCGDHLLVEKFMKDYDGQHKAIWGVLEPLPHAIGKLEGKIDTLLQLSKKG